MTPLPGDAVEAALKRIASDNARLNAFRDVLDERARKRASHAGPQAPLSGTVFGAKSLYDIAGLPTRAGSVINADRPPAARDATVVARLEAAGAVCVGTLGMDEYAYGFTGENVHYGPTRNPHDPDHMTGGSSGGSAAAVAGGLVPLALGSDTNGSIRVPAALCGIFGLKPTYGRLSRAGTFPFVASFDHVGPLAARVIDLARAYDVMQGLDVDDPVCTRRPAEPTAERVNDGIKGLRVAVAGGYFAKDGNAEVFAAVAACAKALGASRTVEFAEAERARAAAFVITTVEGAALHLDRLRQRGAEFDPAVRERLLAGAMIPASLAVRAQTFRRWFATETARLFREVDLVLAPATPCTAPRIGQSLMEVGGRTLPVRAHLGLYAQPLSFIGLPVATVPVWVPGERLPLGVQVIAAPWREDLALRAAAFLEESGVSNVRIGRG